MKIAVIGATGTAGTRTVAKLKDQDISTVEISRSNGVDLITGDGLHEALKGVDVAIDTSNAFPRDDSIGLYEALTSATRNVVEASCSQRVEHLVFLSISGIENPVFENFSYYLAKRAQEELIANSSVPSTIVKSTQWFEFATNPAAVTFYDDEVRVADWLIQPVAVDTVAGVMVEEALSQICTSTTKTIAGPEVIRLPDLTTKLLKRLGDPRPVRVTPPSLPALSEGVLLAPNHATILGPNLNTWLHTINLST